MATTRFNVVLEVDLTKSQKAIIQRNINSAVAKSLLQIDLKGNAWGSKIMNKEWYGRWLHLFKSTQDLKNSKTFVPAKLG